VGTSGRSVLRRADRRVALLLIAAGGASCAIAAATATGASSQRVTLTMHRFFDPTCAPLAGQAPSPARGGCTRLRFSGTIASGAPNEYVAVLHQRCGFSGVGTSVVGTQTGESGLWEATWGATAGTFRARWMDNAGRIASSEPLRFRGPVPFSLTRLSSYRQRVDVTGDQDMKGRIIELQRHAGGRWRPVRRSRLVRHRGSYDTSSWATFVVRRRGLVLRAFVPAKSASPCYAPTASDQWTSGPEPGAPLGTRVIDRTLLCNTGMQGGLRMVSIAASSARGPDLIEDGPSFSVSSGFARPPGFASASTTSITLYPDRCTGSGALVSLKPGKLRRAAPGPFGRSFDCEAPRRVYVRMRTVFFEPAALDTNRDSGYRTLFAQGRVAEAAIAVRTPSGQPLVLATMFGSTARLFTGRTCLED
jgi:hypothetical protein